MNKIFKLRKLFLCSFLLLFTLTYKIQAAERVSLTLEYDGRTVLYENEKVFLNVNERIIDNLPLQPIIISDRIYAPVSEVFRAMGAVVDWKDETKQVYIGYGDNLIILQIDQNFININGTTVQIPVAPKIINNKTMIPISFAADALGFFVHWDPESRTVTVIDPSSHQVPPSSVQSQPTVPQTGIPSGQGETVRVDPEPEQGPYIAPAIDPNVEISVSIASFARDISSSVITQQQFPTTTINGITQGQNSYTISAGSEITYAVKTLLKDNRFIIDIYNAELNMANKTIGVNNSYLQSIRVAQNQVEPEKVTRVVFDITAAVSFSVSMAPDRKSITVSFEKNYITDVSYVPEGPVDRLYISGVVAPIVSLSTGANRLTVDLPLASVVLPMEIPVHGGFADKMAISQIDADSGRVQLDMKGAASYSVSNLGNMTIITISKQSYQNISYDSNSKTITLAKPDNQPVDIAKITHTDNYLNLKYSLSLPGDFSGFYGSGTHLAGDDYISSFEAASIGGRTTFTINENKVLAYIVSEDAKNIYIKAVLPKQKYSKIVVIDPGHGLTDPGTNGHGLVEKNVNLDIALRLAKLLEESGTVKCYSTRLADTYPTRAERAIFANELGDVFVSIHNNALDASNPSKGVANGTETYYYPHANDAALGYSSQKMAEMFQKNLVADLGTYDRKHKYGDLQVLRETTIPAVLCEIGFMDHPSDAANLASDSFKQRAAASLMRSILQVFDTYKPKR